MGRNGQESERLTQQPMEKSDPRIGLEVCQIWQNQQRYLCRTLGNYPHLWKCVEMTTQKLKQSIVDLLKDPVALKEKLEKERVIDVKKALKLSQVMALIPTDMGLPLVVDVTMPMLVSVKGKAKVGLSWTKPLLDLTTEMFYSLQLFGTVGVVNPLNKEYVSTSIDQTLAATVPIATKVEMDLVQQSVKVSAKIHCQCSNPNEQKVKL